ncbi:1-acyl-sn-glycerol-3-phosphate acyltransferase [Allobranchiibius sp. CTAmp26]|uniref:lysophospholipid acyltransferase family protein n=1 Tax=Allobranchiibius sp. CTAmp26 TaxID=2815214 RepID=UPI001AA0CACE|nr:lysophospholipid acyltransferase family protein [Allobranchiibius sp. CTAmp26]MBO1756185.1 1-acyl-sn-glycerol-3-phosphate acyltransferase [Allobranchiibius sp. CTAmp26]
MRHPRPSDDISLLYRGIVRTLRPVLRGVTRTDWRGLENVPASGGFVVAPNHVSYVDPIILGHFLVDQGRAPRFLAKNALFTTPALGRIMANTGQIPVYRETTRAVDAYAAALVALRAGACVCVLPEGTITKDPQMWPMTGKTGAARLALETGLPLVPVGIWGTQQLMRAYHDKMPHLVPPKRVQVYAGPPVDLTDLADRVVDREVLATATDRLMDAIAAQVSLARGLPVPADRYDPRDDMRRGGRR